MNETLDSFIETEDVLKFKHDIYFEDSINISKLNNECVNLIVTSPPYWSIKDYGNLNQLGFGDSYSEYLDKLMNIFTECERVLSPKGNFCVNIGNQFIKTSQSKTRMFDIIPIYEDLVHLFKQKFPHLSYIGTINWKKTTTSNTSGGGSCMGSQNYPPSGLFFTNREFIFIFRKGGERKYNPELKTISRLSKSENKWLSDEWSIKGERQPTFHKATFPLEIPHRLIKLFSMVGDTVLDPFLGTGTTIKASSMLGRNSIGYEIGFGSNENDDFKQIIKEKIEIKRFQISYPLKDSEDYGAKIIENRYNYN